MRPLGADLGAGWADAPMTAPKPQIDCDTVSDGRRGRVRAGGGERGSADGLNRRGSALALRSTGRTWRERTDRGGPLLGWNRTT